ncbi:hypothetical protein [Brevibacillus dissolubilis]|uniref:hypothetical protein n=1 Tax=Brevibacillus dissolubilis TaxID=1844116 RepID=UPI001117915F|nr:hypothetical protein [Brevibacillus dissolubilis]
MLPDIIQLAEKNQLVFAPRQTGKEVRCKCPFCRSDEGRKDKYFLSINPQKQVFKCWFCHESGGVCRLEALLTGVPESQVIDKYKTRSITERRLYHPAEKLTARQLAQIGFVSKTPLFLLKQRDRGYYQRTCQWIWQEWQEYIESQRYQAFRTYLVGVYSGKLQKAVAHIREQERKVGVELLRNVLRIYASPTWPAWAKEAQHFALELCRSTITPPLPMNA